MEQTHPVKINYLINLENAPKILQSLGDQILFRRCFLIFLFNRLLRLNFAVCFS